MKFYMPLLIILFSGSWALSQDQDIEFFYQPHEASGLSCWSKPSGQPHGLIVTCGSKLFRVHHFVREFQNSQGKSWEFIYLVSDFRNTNHRVPTGAHLALKATALSQMTEIKLSQVIEGDTATLDLTVPIPPQN